jgi:hypothetical protein
MLLYNIMGKEKKNIAETVMHKQERHLMDFLYPLNKQIFGLAIIFRNLT